MKPSLPEEGPPAPPEGPSDAGLAPEDYGALRDVAARYLGDARRVTLTPTSLVHEAWLRVGGGDRGRWRGPEHFKASAARAMRHILVDRARSARAQRRHVTLASSVFAIQEPELDLEALHRALGRLEESDERSARVVELLFFGGLAQEEAAAVLEVSLRTVQGDWAYARSWLLREMESS